MSSTSSFCSVDIRAFMQLCESRSSRRRPLASDLAYEIDYHWNTYIVVSLTGILLPQRYWLEIPQIGRRPKSTPLEPSLGYALVSLTIIWLLHTFMRASTLCPQDRLQIRRIQRLSSGRGLELSLEYASVSLTIISVVHTSLPSARTFLIL